MGRRKQYIVELTDKEVSFLKTMLNRGTQRARVLRRANILLLANQGKTVAHIAESLQTTPKTVTSIRKKYCQGDLHTALFDAPRPGGKSKLDHKQEAHLIALACSKPPEGRVTWTMQLLADRMIELEIVDTISDETVRRTLKKTASSRGKRKVGVLQK